MSKKIRDGWSYIYSSCEKEAERIRHCRGCKYLAYVGGFGCCEYYLRTDKRRPCKFADPNCPVKDVPENFVMPAKFLDWRDKVDQKEAERIRKLEKQRERELTEKYKGNPIRETKKRGRPAKWDIEYAKLMYDHGYYFFEICDILHVSQTRVSSYSYKNNWVDAKPRNVVCTYHDLAPEPDRYARFCAARESGDLDDAFISDLFGEPTPVPYKPGRPRVYYGKAKAMSEIEKKLNDMHNAETRAELSGRPSEDGTEMKDLYANRSAAFAAHLSEDGLSDAGVRR